MYASAEAASSADSPAASAAACTTSPDRFPKIAVFFVSLLPQFVTPGVDPFLGLVLLGLLFSAMGLAWLTMYAAVVAKAGELLRGRVRRAIDAIVGTVLVAFGVRLATER